MKKLLNKILPIGSRSLLFGVHAFWFHPIVVGLAWRRIYESWPSLSEWICIVVHDWGYWGCAEMDGPEGKEHPVRGAEIAAKLVRSYRAWQGGSDYSWDTAGEWAYRLSLGHSTHYAQKHLGGVVSKLYLPDKASVLEEPCWFYLLRGWLTGETAEYVRNEDPSLTVRQWLESYRIRIKIKCYENCRAKVEA